MRWPEPDRVRGGGHSPAETVPELPHLGVVEPEDRPEEDVERDPVIVGLPQMPGSRRDVEGVGLLSRDCDVHEPTAVRIDRTRLEQVLLNLVLNARDAVDRSGTVHVTADTVDISARSQPEAAQLAEGRYQRITVTDTGRGIDSADLPHIFDPFFTTKSEGQAAGLGLYTSREIVRGSGGDLAVESNAEGTSVSVFLPSNPDPAAG